MITGKAWLGALLSLSLVASQAAGAKPGGDGDDDQARLVILISVDQFSADLFTANRHRFRHGFARLSAGTVYSNAYFGHGLTETCAGHALLVTGRDPRDNGIVSNNWFDPDKNRQQYCTEDGKGQAATEVRTRGVGPGLLAADTVGDWLKRARPAAKVFAVAGKDRSAIMMAGHAADAAYWLNGSGTFDTWGPDQKAARSRLKWLDAFNAKLPAKLAVLKRPWTYADGQCRLREAKFILPDGQELQATLPPQAPLAMPGFPQSGKDELPGWATDELTLDAAYALILSAQLGADSSPDFLAIGLSGTDIIGHAYGTAGPEMCDHLYRLDRALGRFLSQLDALKMTYTIMLTADHGGSDMAVRLEQDGYRDAKHLDAASLLKEINAKVMAKAAIDWAPLRPSGFDITQLILTAKDGSPLKDQPFAGQIARYAADEARSRPEVLGAWTRSELETHRVDQRLYPALLSLQDRMALSQYPGRGSDVVLALRPLLSALPPLPGRFMMGHGGPSDHDRRVPIMIWHKGDKPRERVVNVQMINVAPTLASMLGIRSDPTVSGYSLEGR